jgi:hypothetical protein
MNDEERLAEYSRGRADAETEFKETVTALVHFLEKAGEDATRALKEYKGKQETSNKIMCTYWGAKKAAFSELLERLRWEFPFAFEE